ncbi:hypothetical protein R9C00_05480 [Flammeovirgaceae bacterium SG7u.111]|nr:hypothetical protein [Flammeovirgaceae bacterium SG7u.132]WPO36892.1 hypothetical protein R9C00_05480 [Flammeovirgaceae bacterium SG7u.111]
MMQNKSLFALFLSLSLIGCRHPKDAPDTSISISNEYEEAEVLGTIENNEINEASGIATSVSFKNAIWTHNDSGGKNSLFLLDKAGKHLAEFVLEGIENRDWEDIAVGPGPTEGTNYIYLAETGDNQAQYEGKYIYRFAEPESYTGSVKPDTIHEIETLSFSYPDGNRDAETIMVNPLNKDIYIVSKREDNVHFYRAAFPQSTTKTFPLEKLGVLPFYNVTAGDISPDGKELLLKNYYNIYYWKVKEGNIPNTMLKTDAVRLTYEPESQGESIAFSRESEGGFYTVSEENGDEAVVLFYPRAKK